MVMIPKGARHVKDLCCFPLAYNTGTPVPNTRTEVQQANAGKVAICEWIRMYPFMMANHFFRMAQSPVANVQSQGHINLHK